MTLASNVQHLALIKKGLRHSYTHIPVAVLVVQHLALIKKGLRQLLQESTFYSIVQHLALIKKGLRQDQQIFQ